MNIVWLDSKSVDDRWKLRLGKRDVCLLESLLTDPETHEIIEPVFEQGTLNVVSEFVIDTQQKIDLHSLSKIPNSRSMLARMWMDGDVYRQRSAHYDELSCSI